MTIPSSRRSFLTTTLGVAGLAVGSALPAAETDDVGIQGVQDNWRFCERCCVLFYAGYPQQGICPLGGPHRAQGWNFYLHYDFPGGQNWQIGWRFCPHCYSLFWPFAPVPWGHPAQGWVFALNHDVGETPQRQQHWRFCRACNSLFYWGFADNGICPAGGGHKAQGFDFCLYHT
jgi:hypothetical protein